LYIFLFLVGDPQTLVDKPQVKEVKNNTKKDLNILEVHMIPPYLEYQDHMFMLPYLPIMGKNVSYCPFEYCWCCGTIDLVVGIFRTSLLVGSYWMHSFCQEWNIYPCLVPIVVQRSYDMWWICMELLHWFTCT